MEKNKCGNRYSPAVRERALRMVFEHKGNLIASLQRSNRLRPRLVVGRIRCVRGLGELKPITVDAMV